MWKCFCKWGLTCMSCLTYNKHPQEFWVMTTGKYLDGETPTQLLLLIMNLISIYSTEVQQKSETGPDLCFGRWKPDWKFRVCLTDITVVQMQFSWALFVHFNTFIMLGFFFLLQLTTNIHVSRVQADVQAGHTRGDKTLSGLTCVSFLYENLKCPTKVDFVKELAFLFNHVVNLNICVYFRIGTLGFQSFQTN